MESDCTVKRRQLMGQTVYKSDVGYRSILLYLFQLNYNSKSAFVMSNTFQRTFQHLVDANTVLQSVIPPLPPHPASSYTSSFFPTCSESKKEDEPSPQSSSLPISQWARTVGQAILGIFLGIGHTECHFIGFTCVKFTF